MLCAVAIFFAPVSPLFRATINWHFPKARCGIGSLPCKSRLKLPATDVLNAVNLKGVCCVRRQHTCWYGYENYEISHHAQSLAYIALYKCPYFERTIILSNIQKYSGFVLQSCRIWLIQHIIKVIYVFVQTHFSIRISNPSQLVIVLLIHQLKRGDWI